MKNSRFNPGSYRFPVIVITLLIAGFSFFAGHSSGQSVPVTFRVDMTNQFELGLFDPMVDSVDIMGTMNGWTGSPAMTKYAFSLVYEIIYNLEPGTIQEFKFRKRGESTIIETPNCGPNRMYRVPGSAATTLSVFSDYEPGTVPVLFECNMSFQVRTARFNMADDYLDIASSINNYGGYDLLYNRSTDSTYEICINVDTGFVTSQTPILYKFRINGDTATMELKGQDYRMARIQDTTGGHENIYFSWYNNEAPDIPNPPVAYNVNLQGEPRVGQTLTGTYMYADVNGDPEGTSTYRWYRADSPAQAVPDTIPGEISVNYLISVADSGKYVAFEVTPVANSDEYNIGLPVKTWSSAKITNNVGINDLNSKQIRVFPNPATDYLMIRDTKGIEKIEVFSLVGSMVLSHNIGLSEDAKLNIRGLEPGIYFIKLYTTDKGHLTSKFVKN